MKADELVADVTGKIIAQLENGVLPWVRPWATEHIGWPMNPVTGKDYTGFNAVYLNMAGMPYSSSLWLTYKQAEAAGGQVRKGEKGTHALRPIEIKREFDQAADPDASPQSITFFKGYAVFNLDQVDGLEHLRPSIVVNRTEPLPRDPEIERVIKSTGAEIRYGGNECYYTPDYIQMVEPERFESASKFYATEFHELSHWTGGRARLDRLPNVISMKDPAYGREELVAELSSAFCCQAVGIDGIDRHSATYIAAWLQILKADKTALLKVTKHAREAFEYIVGPRVM